MGRSIYFTEQEIEQLIMYTGQAITILGEGEDTHDRTEEDIENGLGSALRKLHKGTYGESDYLKYKTKRGRRANT